MGQVLAFQTAPRAASRTPSKRSEPAQSADILFFTGVRYERHAAAAPSSALAPYRSGERESLGQPAS